MSVVTLGRALLRRRGKGYMVSPDDLRDVLRLGALGAGASLRPLPEAAMWLDRGVSTPHDQGATNSCTAHAIDHAVQALCSRSAGPHDDTYSDRSRAAPYWWARSLAGLETRDDGAFLRDAFKAWAWLGAPPEAAARLSYYTVLRQPSATALRLGRPWRGVRYARVAGTPEGRHRAAMEALAGSRPLVGGWALDKAFLDGDGHDVVDSWQPDGTGGHAMAVTGYDRAGDRFRVVNSWGTDWRDAGRVWLTAEALLQATELWVVEGWA